MPRPKRIRYIRFQPEATYFKPVGIPLRNLEEEKLTYEETEVLRLIDVEEQEQGKACKKMKISQPTLSRLLKSGRKKISEAIINGKAIKIQGGTFKMVRGRGLGQGKAGRGGGRMGGFGLGPGGMCVCPKCGYQEPQMRGQPCMNKKCPKCGNNMTRK